MEGTYRGYVQQYTPQAKFQKGLGSPLFDTGSNVASLKYLILLLTNNRDEVYTYTYTYEVYRRLARHSPRAEANNAIAYNIVQWNWIQ